MSQYAALTPEELERYQRNVLLKDVGIDGQLKLKSASVLIVGVGGLGSPIGLYLAGAGVGRIGIVDGDTVNSSNLQRQVLYGEDDIGKNKAETASARLRRLNRFIEVVSFPQFITRGNIDLIADSFDILVDGTDNAGTRYIVNEYCVRAGKPYVYGSIYQYEGQVCVFDAAQGPCYNCLFPDIPADRNQIPEAESGVFGVLPGTIGTIEATETLKLILSLGEPLIGKFLLYDLRSMTFKVIKLVKNPNCAVCGTRQND